MGLVQRLRGSLHQKGNEERVECVCVCVYDWGGIFVSMGLHCVNDLGKGFPNVRRGWKMCCTG